MFYLYDRKQDCTFYSIGEGLISGAFGERVIVMAGDAPVWTMPKSEARKMQHLCLAHGYRFEIQCKLRLVTEGEE